jgi:hypothetical protein
MSTQFDPLRTTALELPPMSLHSLEDFLRFPIKKITTDSGLDLIYFENCSAGGEHNSKKILEIISTTGKRHYRHAHEWCCGHAAIGLELLHQGFCDRLSLSDQFLPAIISAEFSVALNGWQDRAQVYQIKEFSSLPKINCDLIVADPPHLCSGKGLSANQDGLRQVVDHDWRSHEDLFANLTGRLSPDGDLYLYEGYYGSDADIWAKMAAKNGLRMIGFYSTSSDNYVAHFRY